MKIRNFISKSPIVPTLMCSRHIESNLQKTWKGEKVSVWEALILASLFFEDRECRPSEIATSLQMSRSQVSQTIKRLAQSGLVFRELSKLNARTVNLSLTPKGKRLAMKAIKGFDSLSQTIDRKLDARASESIAKSLLQLTH